MSEDFLYVIHCAEDNGYGKIPKGGMWSLRNPQYPECLSDPELVELVKKKDDLEYCVHEVYKGSKSERAKDKREALAECLEAIKTLATTKWPDGDWSSYRSLVATQVKKGTTAIIVESYGNEELIITSTAIVFKP